MPLYKKHFSIEEARACLPFLRSKFSEIRALYAEIENLRADFERVLRIIQSNGHAPKAPPLEARIIELRKLVGEIMEKGIEVKDVGRGLVDFPCWHHGEEVFLCWELAEDDIRFWHRIEDGYAGRQPLAE